MLPVTIKQFFVQFLLWQCYDTPICLPFQLPQLVKSLLFNILKPGKGTLSVGTSPYRPLYGVPVPPPHHHPSHKAINIERSLRWLLSRANECPVTRVWNQRFPSPRQTAFLRLRAPSARSKLILWRQPPALTPPEWEPRDQYASRRNSVMIGHER